MANIHPTAIVDPKAKLGENVTISAFAIVHGDVEIGDDTFIGPQANIYDGARIGKRVKIFQAASIAHIPQDLKFNYEPSICVVGDDTKIHEFVTLHRGTKETGLTQIGKNVLLMAYSHVAHDTLVGDNCIIANGVQVAGHVLIEDWVIIGGMTPVHQFCKVGKHSMIGGGYRIVQDVPPFIMCAGEPLRYGGINVIGLRRRGFSAQQIEALKNVYRLIYNSGLNLTQAKEKIVQTYANESLASEVLDFLSKATRGIVGK